MQQIAYEGARQHLKLFQKPPVSIERTQQDSAAEWRFEDGSSIAGACVGCIDEPCRLVHQNEQVVPSLSSFSRSRNSALCPVEAMSWDNQDEVPVIDQDACIGCGLCVARCPVGAISMKEHVASVATPTDSHLLHMLTSRSVSVAKSEQRSQLTALPPIKATVPVQDDAEVVTVSRKLKHVPEPMQRRAVRSVLVAAGNTVAISRQGDVHTRMDGIYSNGSELGSLEVEFGNDSLESIRATLDDIAVLHCRYKLDLKKQDPLVVCLSLPRERQGYWQVISDISRVLGIEVRTVTFAALLLLVWNGKVADNQALSEFIPKFGSTSIRDATTSTLGREVALAVGEEGILEPEK